LAAGARDYAWRMDGASLARVRWRLRGAWQWPTFAALTVADAVIGHAFPPSGEGQSLPAAALDGLVLNLLAVLLLSRPLGALVRRIRRDLPSVVARDYAGAWVVIAVTGALLGAGLAHRSSVDANRRAMQEAVARAQAYIGARAPVAFRRNIERVDMFEIQAGSVYRACVASSPDALDGSSPATPDASIARTYCVVVNLRRPWRQSVRFGGYEPNSTFSQGVG